MRAMLKIFRRFATIGLVTLSACAGAPVAVPLANQFANPPQSATTPPAISDFRTPLQLLDQRLEMRLRNIEQELENCLKRVSCRQPT